MLLVLALGRAVQEEGFLLQDPPVLSSTPHSYSSSPRYSSPRPQGVGSPMNGAGRSATEKTHSRFRGKRRHTDIYPGLAYYAYASDILGNNNGGNKIIHAQAQLLAGLYLMQLGRVVESSAYVHRTFAIATILRAMLVFATLPSNLSFLTFDRRVSELYDTNIEMEPIREPMNDELTIISMLCWSALQLESYVWLDLCSELDTDIR